MADERSVVERGVEKLKKEITYSVCHGHYNDFKMLSLLLRTGLDRQFSCPKCFTQCLESRQRERSFRANNPGVTEYGLPPGGSSAGGIALGYGLPPELIP